MKSIFADYGRKYFEAGYSVIPVRGKGQPIEPGFQRFSKSLPSEDQITNWENNNQALNIGLVLGLNRIICLDVDYDGEGRDEFLSGIRGVCPEIVSAKKGKKGISIFYRSDLTGKKLCFDSKKPVVEVLSVGNYTIIPPSIHEKTLKPYFWVDGTKDLIDLVPGDLPEFTEQDLENVKVFISDFFSRDIEDQSGRNNYLGAFMFRSARFVKSEKEMLAMVMAKDLSEFGGNSYYADQSENKGKKPEDFAAEHVKRSISWLRAKNKERGVLSVFLGEGVRDVSGSLTIDDIIKTSSGHYEVIEKVGKDGSISERKIPDYNSLSDCLKDNNVFKSADIGCFLYRNGYWKISQEIELDGLILKMTLNQAAPDHLGRFKKFTKAKCFFDFEAYDGAKEAYKINLKNGVLDLKDDSLQPHSSFFHFKNKLPISYDKDANCDRWIEFLNFVFKGDQDLILMAQRLFGYILIGGEPFLHRAFVLYGSGRNGKSTFIEILRDILGESSYSVVSMGSLNKPFSSVCLDGKLANIVEETPNAEINSELFKNMVGGGKVQVSHKGRDEFSLRVNARFVFACNDMPIFKDKNKSLEDRLIFMPFDVYIKEEDRDTDILVKLRAELPGVLNWAIEGARRVMGDRKIIQPAASLDLKQQYKEETDPTYCWFKENIFVQANSKPISYEQIYERYKNDMEQGGYYQLSIRKFLKRIKPLIAGDLEKMDMTLSDQVRTIVIEGVGVKRAKAFDCVVYKDLIN